MALRSARVALILAALGVLGCTPAQRPPKLKAGEHATPLIAASGPAALRATWVFNDADLVRCRSSARELRHLQARFGRALETMALAVDADPRDVTGFLRVQRVGGPVRYIRRREHRDEMGRLLTPALYITRGDRIEAVYPGVPLDDDFSIKQRNVEGRVAALLGGPSFAAVATSANTGS